MMDEMKLFSEFIEVNRLKNDLNEEINPDDLISDNYEKKNEAVRKILLLAGVDFEKDFQD
jgi:hypothetical protein